MSERHSARITEGNGEWVVSLEGPPGKTDVLVMARCKDQAEAQRISGIVEQAYSCGFIDGRYGYISVNDSPRQDGGDAAPEGDVPEGDVEESESVQPYQVAGGGARGGTRGG
ncbi:hypothetical protein J2852_001516 [Azospirillum soli]|nr:hypothetical protein [Azospirillum soli]